VRSPGESNIAAMANYAFVPDSLVQEADDSSRV
jgi:hypothetical protein